MILKREERDKQASISRLLTFSKNQDAPKCKGADLVGLSCSPGRGHVMKWAAKAEPQLLIRIFITYNTSRLLQPSLIHLPKNPVDAEAQCDEVGFTACAGGAGGFEHHQCHVFMFLAPSTLCGSQIDARNSVCTARKVSPMGRCAGAFMHCC